MHMNYRALNIKKAYKPFAIQQRHQLREQYIRSQQLFIILVSNIQSQETFANLGPTCIQKCIKAVGPSSTARVGIEKWRFSRLIFETVWYRPTVTIRMNMQRSNSVCSDDVEWSWKVGPVLYRLSVQVRR